MPAGFHVATAWVDVQVEADGLRGEIQRAIRGAAEGQDGKVKLNLDAADLRAKVENAIKSASAGATGEVKLDLDAGSLRGKVEGAIRAATAGARGEVNLDLDAGSLRAKVQAAMQSAVRGVRGTVNVDGDTSKLLAQVGAAVGVINGMEANIKTDVDTAGMQAKIRAAVASAGANTRIRVDTDIDYVGKFAAFRAFVAGFRPTVHVDVDVDSNQWAAGMRALAAGADGATRSIGGVTRGLTSMRGLISSGPQVLGPLLLTAGVAAGVLAINVAGIAAALASIALPAGVIALGAWLQSARVDFAAFGNELKSLGQSFSASMAPAIQAGMRTILGGLQQLGPQITSMFSNAAQLVQPFAQSLMNLASGALPGITAALSNMGSAMPGILSGFQQIGQGVGNFFRELTSNGPAIGQLWSTIGTGINQVATSLGQALSQITSNPAALQTIGQSFQVLAQTIQLAGTALTAFAPVFNQVLQSMSAGLAAIEPVIDGVGRLTGAFSAFVGGGGPMAAWDALTGKQVSGSEKMAKAMDEANKKMRESQSIAKDFGGGFGGFDMAAAQAQVLKQNVEAVNQAMARVGAVGGTGLGQIAGMLTQASQGAQAFNQSLGQMNTNAQSALQGQIGLAQAISQAKSQQSSFKDSLSMSNGQLDLTSTKAQGAAQALNQIAQAGTQAATAFANQGNFTAAAASLEKARSAIVSLGQSFGLPKAQAQELANSLLQIPDKEVQFKLNVGAAMNSLNQVKSAFDKVGSEEKKVTVTAMTEPAQAALEALGFKIKDLGNGKVEVTANTDSAKAALDGLKTVLDALQNKQARVQVSADQVPAVTAALEALGAKVETLPNGDVKITAEDGATTVIESVKSGLDGIPDSKTTKWTMTGDLTKPQETATVLDDIPQQKDTNLNATGNAPDKAAEALSSILGIPADKVTALTATGNADQKAGEVKLKIDGLPDQKAIIVIVNISGVEQIDKLEKLNDVQNKAISVQVAITGTEQISKLEALNKVNNKNISVNVNVTGADQISKLEALNKVNNKNILVSVMISGADQISKLEGINRVNNKSIVVNVQVSGADQISKLEGINKVNNKNIVVNVSITGQIDKIEQLKQLNSISNKSISVSVNLTGIDKLSQIKNLPSSKTVTVTVKENGLSGVKSKISGIAGKTVTITVKESGAASVKSKISGISGKTVTINVRESGVAAVQSAINSIQGKTVTVTVVTKKVGSAASGGYMHEKTLPGFSSGGRSVKSGGSVYGLGSATSDSILARLSNGEFVIRASMVRKYGTDLLSAINHGALDSFMGVQNWRKALPGFHSGGSVGSAAGMVNLYDVQPGDRNSQVLAIQKALKEIFPEFDYSSGPGIFGPRTREFYSKFQRSMGWSGSDANGSPGILSLIALMNRTSEFQLKTSQATMKYNILHGDTMQSVAAKFGIAVEDLIVANKDLVASSKLVRGMSINIPTGFKGVPPPPPPGVLAGTKPGDWNFLDLPNFSKIARRTEKDDKGKYKEVSEVNELMGMAGQNMQKQTKMFENFTNTNKDDLVRRIVDSNDLASLAVVLDDMRQTVAGSFKDGTAKTNLQNYLAKGAKIEITYHKMLEDTNKKLEEAQKNLDKVNGEFESLQSSVASTVGQFATLTKTGKAGASVETMLRQLSSDAGLSTQFTSSLAAMRARGLSGTTLAQVAALGPQEGQRTLTNLLRATPEQIAQINALQDQIDEAARVSGSIAANAMYGAGVNAAKGLVDGLTSQKDAITDAMTRIADAMKTAILQALGIKSPSRVMFGYGVNTIQGYVNGMLAQGKSIGEIVRGLISQVTENANGTVKSTIAASGTGGGTATTTTAPTGDVRIGNIHVTFQCDGGAPSSPEEAEKYAKMLATYVMEEIRKENKKRK